MTKMNLLRILTIMIVTILSVGFVSCGGDDVDETINVNSYIIGTWRSFKATGYAQGESVTLDISKNGEYSSAYLELVFNSDGTVIGSNWQQDSSGVSRWVSEKGNYIVNGNMVDVTFSDGTASLTFDASDRTLCFRAAQNVNGTNITINLFLRK